MATSIAAPSEAWVTKIDFQPNHTSRYPPMKGATSGDTPSTSTSMEKMRRRSTGGNKSRTMARETTAPPQAPMACSNRNIDNALTEVERAQAAEENTNSARLK